VRFNVFAGSSVTAPSPALEASAAVALPLSEWHEDIGPALWWFFPMTEPPYVGGPTDSDWPGYHTHWTPLPDVPTAADPSAGDRVGVTDET
jgi:hypothetical protein